MKKRSEERHEAMIRARLIDSGPQRDACILDLSSRGILATAARPPEKGAFVELAVGDRFIVGQVKWSSQRRFGLTLRERIDVIALLSGKGGDIRAKPGGASAGVAGASRRARTGTPDYAGRLLQFVGLAAAAVIAALLLAQIAGAGLSSLQRIDGILSARQGAGAQQ